MSEKINDWFAGQLGKAGIHSRPLEDYYPANMPSLHIEPDNWADTARLAKELNMRFVALWGDTADRQSDTHLHAFMAFAHPDHKHVLLRTALNPATPTLPSISSHYVSAVRMERTLQDMFGMKVDGLPDTRSWIKHEHWPRHVHPLLSSFKPNTVMPRMEGEYPFLKADGAGVYEIPVGPVHAGIIEPGHFRFLAVGEQILNMEQRLGYVHKGVEKRIEGMRADEAIKLAGRVSGDATVGHGWAFAKACESAARLEIPERASALRAVLCERERMVNHTGDIGAICNDAAFAFMNVNMQRLREDMARLNKELFGHRLLMDLLAPGGLNRDIDTVGARKLAQQTSSIAEQVKQLRDIYANNPSIQARVVGSGVVSQEDAGSIGLLGYAGRASGLSSDVRVDNPYPPYDRMSIRTPSVKDGDVSARVYIRFEEIQESARMIRDLLADLPGGKTCADWRPPENGAVGFSVIESWRGEIACQVRFGHDGIIERYMARDPSAINWLGLELAVRNVQVPDFPLNNKSFNCSYSGNDL